MTLRWGVVGTGKIAGALSGTPGRCPTRGSSPWDPDRRNPRTGSATPTGSRGGTPPTQALVADPEVDAVYVATPHPLHAENALAAIEAGKHVLVEKPFTMNAAEAASVVEAARAAGVFCMEAMWTRFLPHIGAHPRAARGRRARRGPYGLRRSRPELPARPEHRLFAPELGGGALLDLGDLPGLVRVDGARHAASVTAVADPAFTGVDGQTTRSCATRTASTASRPAPCGRDRRGARGSPAPTA